ncbi:hypothetical protein VF14_27065 [Nostoc linckia z18]|uniref:Uncharacterized protein n=2 Tax=Nostoc linckia TaxID=92942 RepID=A0A9Q5Z6B9_NOSLI|nr:hypothetical protein [Nostoc linckia]PHK29735.1 hypothetical protein VF12_30610 [Nostoc linckia z15]PHK42199.1 hypothetical protein VF13_30075 [Nostoc linckia z16]PHJ59445.1 hypothetical protein VF02_24875 [Nostoc linckia z1]PHJ62646.1 hypothetical protein VF05_26085 [Nostoc linckia z3]PHJ68798.1 hypothetical protein VF03_24355 [Nostoc linckia z2]
MTISQQISPSALRAYKLSKYANGQPGKLLLEARKARRITSQFMSKSGAKEAAKKMKALKQTAAATKKASDLTEKIHKALFSKIPGSNFLDSASRVGGILGILSAIGLVALTKLQEFITDRTFDNLDAISNDLTKTNQIAVQNGLKLKQIQSKVDKFEKELNINAKDYARLNKQTETIGQQVTAAKKQANDALYETREGRKIVTGLAEAARKLANDALYEARQNKVSIEARINEQRISFDAKIQSINAQISKFNNSVGDTFQRSVNATISKLQSDLAATKAQVSAKPQNVDTNSITANAIAAAKSVVAPLQSQIANTNNIVNGLQAQVAQIPVLANAVSSLGKNLNLVDNKADAAMNEARNKGVPNLAPIQQQLDDKFNRFVADNNKALGIRDLQISDLSKDFDKKLADFNRLNNLTSEQRFQEFKKENDKALAIRDLQQSNLSKEFDQRFADFKRQNELTSEQRFEEFERENRQSLGLLKGDVQQINRDINTTKSDITKIDTRLKDQEKVNSAALPKLDQILDKLPFIPALSAAAIRPDIPTIPQIEQAAATGTCRTTQPGGCMRRALDDNAANIIINNNTNAANLLNAYNAGANTALLQGQATILERLGAQLPGGIGGKLGRLSKWLLLDRVLNILTWWQTLHNAAMLSNNIVQTLASGVNNVLAFIGVKDDDDNPIDVGQILGQAYTSAIKSALGEETYNNLNKAFNAANRIYQSAANVAFIIQSIQQSILTALEVIGSGVAKIANGLKAAGKVFDRAYEWMNPNPNFDNALFRTLEGAQQIASNIELVSQTPLDVQTSLNSLKEERENMKQALKDGENALKGLGIIESDNEKNSATQRKEISAGQDLENSDKLEADD